MIERNFDNNNENCIEFLSGERTATVSFTNRKHINRMKKLHEERHEEFKYFKENDDGSICAKIPLKWVKINAGSKPGSSNRTRTPEQIEAAKQALAKWREENKKNNSNK